MVVLPPVPHRLHYRWAFGADVDAIVALVDSAYRGESSRHGWTTEADFIEGQRTDAAGVRQVLTAPRSWILLAHDEQDALVACCQLVHRPTTTAYFGMFAVRPGLQGAGIGGLVMEEAERIARRWGAPAMSLAVLAPRDELIAWYERRGYARTGATDPFPYGDERFGRPVVADLHFVLLEKKLP